MPFLVVGILEHIVTVFVSTSGIFILCQRVVKSLNAPLTKFMLICIESSLVADHVLTSRIRHFVTMTDKLVNHPSL